jgi:hypothetical protein
MRRRGALPSFSATPGGFPSLFVRLASRFAQSSRTVVLPEAMLGCLGVDKVGGGLELLARPLCFLPLLVTVGVGGCAIGVLRGRGRGGYCTSISLRTFMCGLWWIITCGASFMECGLIHAVMCVCVRAFVCACACGRSYVLVRVCVRACVRACVHPL